MATILPSKTKETTTTTGTGTLTLSGAPAGYLTFNTTVGVSNSTPYWLMDANGTSWEVGFGTLATSTTFTRDTVYNNNSGTTSKITLSAGTHSLFVGPVPGYLHGNHTVVGNLAVTDDAYAVGWNGSSNVPTKNAVYDKVESLIGLSAISPGGRLTLCPGDPYYNPRNTVAASGQDTSLETVTLTAHGWSTGTMVVSDVSSGGLIYSTIYYIKAVDANTVAFYTTLANALADTSRVNITGTVTANITALGVANQTIYYTPAVHNTITLWDGAIWRPYTFTELSLAIGTVTASIGYDVFIYNNSGTPALEQLAWTSATARATAVTLQDGRWCKSGDKTRLLLGSYYSRDTTSTESSVGGVISQVGAKLFLDNLTGTRIGHTIDLTDTWSYTTTTIRQANGAAGNKVEIFNCLPKTVVAEYSNAAYVAGSTANGISGIGVDSTTAFSGFPNNIYSSASLASWLSFTSSYRGELLGYHYLARLEKGPGAGTASWAGDNNAEMRTVLTVTI